MECVTQAGFLPASGLQEEEDSAAFQCRLVLDLNDTLLLCVCREGWTFRVGGIWFPNGPSLFKRIPRAGPGSRRALLISSENSGDEKKFMEASRSLFSRPRRGLFSQPWEGDCVREQSSMRWEWARSPSYLGRPPSSAPMRATESGGVGGWKEDNRWREQTIRRSLSFCALLS